MEEGQQEGPERDQEHADHRVSGQGQDGGDGHHRDGDPHIAEVRPAHVGPAADVHDALPDDEQQQGGREYERDGAGRQEDGPHQDAGESQQQGGHVDADGGARLVAADADEQRDLDGEGEPGVLGEELVSHPPVGIAPVGLDQQHPQHEDEGAQDGREDGPELDPFLILDPPVGDEGDEDRRQGGEQQHHQGQDRIAQDEAPAEGAGNLAAFRLLPGVHRIPHPQVAFHELDEAVPFLEDLDDVHVAADVAVLLRVGIIGLGVVMGLHEPGLGLRAEDAVLQREGDGFPVQGRQGAGIIQAAVQEGGLFGVFGLQRGGRERERVGPREGVGGLPPEHALERLVQEFISTETRAGGDPVLVVQEHLLVESGLHARDLLEGEGHVEGEFRSLGIQHDGHLVRRLEHPVEGLALLAVVHHQGVGFLGRCIGLPQLLQQAVQRGLEVLLGDHGAGRKRQQQGKGQEDGVSEEGTDAHGILL